MTDNYPSQNHSQYESDNLPKLFATQATLFPNKTVLIHNDQSLTYLELDHLSNKLAHKLQTVGVHRGTPVAILAERSLETIVSILAILKAGGTYIPLDPETPVSRLHYILTDTKAPFLLARKDAARKTPEFEGQLIHNDLREIQLANLPESPPITILDGDSLAYIIYTSGSTGAPKGVCITHSNVISLFKATQKLFAFNHNDNWALFHSLAFDFSVWELFGALFHGCRLIIVPYDISRSPDDFLNLVCQEKITILNQTPSAFYGFIESCRKFGQQPPKTDLRLIIFGGEALNFSQLEPWFELYGDQQPTLVNMYGITETTVHVTYRKIRRQDTMNACGSLIGVPIPGWSIYLFNQQMEPVSRGSTGEIFVGGSGVAKGYHNRPELTRERFLIKTIQNKKIRLYKSGDLARLTPDGEYEYLGRRDHQVQLRGFRIELGEIEQALLKHEQVSQALAIVREFGPEDKRLIAYVVSRQNQAIISEELHHLLTEHLPTYMVPQYFVILEEFPLTPNGKIDRKSLPDPTKTGITTKGAKDPVTPTEHKLTQIWSELLHAKEINIDDNFFQIGGHSLLATRLLAEIRNTFSKEITFRQFFNQPTIRQLATLIEQDTTSKLQIQHIPKTDRDQPIPLSPTQHLLWVQQQMFPDSCAYNIPTAVEFTGNLDSSHLKKSIENTINRHEILKITFVTNKRGITTQRITPETRLDWDFIDLRDRAPIADDELHDILENEASKPFKLSNKPPSRFRLYQLDEHRFVLLATIHHIIFDAWSREILLSELFENYRATVMQQSPNLSSLPIQYLDFTSWQQARLQTSEIQKQLDYWTRKLASPPVLQLPTDYQRPARFSFRGNRIRKRVSSDLYGRLIELAKREEVTLYILLLAAWYTILTRYSNQDDIIVGMPTTGRTTTESQNLIGYFVNVLPLRLTATPTTPFTKFLARVKQQVLEAFENQEVTTLQIIENISPNQTPERTPLIQNFFTLIETPNQFHTIGNTATSLLPCNYRGAITDISTWFHITDSGTILETEYCTDLFRRETIARMQENFITLLENLEKSRELPLARLPLLADREKELLARWNPKKPISPPGRPVHEKVAEQARLNPDKIALSLNDQRLTYRELDTLANRLARQIQTFGVTPESPVAICMERSLEMVVGILAILKAGGVYVPLDPVYPEARLQYIFSDIEAPLLLTQEKLAKQLPEFRGRVFCPNLAELAQSDLPADAPNSGITLASPAYIIYTSGSTGRPKGVRVTHANLADLFTATKKLFNFSNEDTWSLFHSFSFDFSVWEIWGALIHGGHLVIVPYDVSRSPDDFLNLVKQEKITVLNQTPSAFYGFIESYRRQNRQKNTTSLRLVIFGGEALNFRQLKPWFELHNNKHPTLINMYGITETTVHVTHRKITREDTEKDLGSLIGKPIPGWEIHLLNRQGEPVPIGAVGEIHVGGAGVSEGYHNRPELTRERFVTHSIGDRKIRLYRSGDLARLTPDLELEYLGRSDHQVQLRGFRIELGEIEQTLLQHEAINQALVLVREFAPGDERLLAYLTLKSENKVNHVQLRQFLASHLPRYMIPQHLVILEEFPLTHNGKVDRKALPLPAETSLSTSNHTPPSTKTERTLAKIWREALGINKIGIDDNFFHSGGHSLLAVQIISQLRRETGIDLPLASLFRLSTIRELATFIDTTSKTAFTTRQSTFWSCLVPIQPHGSKPPLFLFHAVGGNVLNYHIFKDYLGPDQPIYGLQARGLDGVTEPFRDMESMAGHYAELVQSVQPEGPYFLAGGSFGGSVALEVARNLKNRGQEIAFLAMFDTYGPNSEEFQLKRLPIHKRILNRTASINFTSAQTILKTILNTLRKQLQELYRYAACRAFRSSNRPTLHKYRYRYIEETNKKIILDYHPLPYQGDIIFFISSFTKETPSPMIMRGWDGILIGKIHTIPIKGKHESFIEAKEFGCQFAQYLLKNQVNTPKVNQ